MYMAKSTFLNFMINELYIQLKLLKSAQQIFIGVLRTNFVKLMSQIFIVIHNKFIIIKLL